MKQTAGGQRSLYFSLKFTQLRKFCGNLGILVQHGAISANFTVLAQLSTEMGDLYQIGAIGAAVAPL